MGYIDVLPTVLASAGVDPAASVVPGQELAGVSLCETLAGKEDALPERDWFSCHRQGGPADEMIAIKTADWKLQVVGPDVRKGFTSKHEVRLFKMPGDLLEKNNLVKRHPEVVATLVKKLKAHRALLPANAIVP